MIRILSNEEMRNADAQCIKTKAPERELIANAAFALFNGAEYKSPVCIVCGAGNNGADGLALAPLLKNAGYETTVYLVSEKCSPQGEYYLDKCKSEGVSVRNFSHGDELCAFATVVDCIFGTGFHGCAEGIYLSAIRSINASGAYVISADINSGINGNSGLGGEYVISDMTVALGEYKYGHFLGYAKDATKVKKVCDIGIPVDVQAAQLIEMGDLKRIFPKRKHNSHKGVYGYVTIIGGSLSYSGAAKLSNLALSALRSGCGVCRLAVPECIAQGVLPYLLESTLFVLDSDSEHIVFNEENIANAVKHTRCVCVGMGIGQGKEQEKTVEYLLRTYRENLIIDADGLNCLANLPADCLKNSCANVILTPHTAEFSRLCKKSCEEILADPVAAASAYARENNVTVLFKGPSTVVCGKNEVYITDTGCAGMATAGSGDVLSGILTGIMGYSTVCDTPFALACGAYLNGYCGMLASQELTDTAMLASDTVKAIPKALKRILSD